MKVRSLVLGLMLSALICWPLLFFHPSARAADTNGEPSKNEPSIVTITNAVDSAELQELRAKLDALQRANDLALGRWSALLDQNSALSNVLTGLQHTLETERRREAELADEARSFNAKVMAGAGAAIFLVFLASYWFQLRCLNRIMEISRTPPELPAPFAPALLEAANTRESKLLEAIKLLEDRLRHLETPVSGNPIAVMPAAIPSTPTTQAATNGTENGHSIASEKVIEVNPAPAPAPAHAAEPPLATKVSVLLAKGEVLLETERLQEAVNSFNEALAYDPNNAEAHLKKGIALERLNRLEQALTSYNEALRLNPKRSFAYVHKARVLAALHRYDEALSVYDMALGKNGGKGAMNGGAAELSRVQAQA